MYLVKATTCVFLTILLTACNPLYLSAPATDVAVNNSTTTAGITERTALEGLLSSLEQRPNADVDCLQFIPESNNDDAIATTWEFAAMEVHDEICGGDPDVGHVRNRYKVNANGSIMIYDPREGEYEPLKDLQ